MRDEWRSRPVTGQVGRVPSDALFALSVAARNLFPALLRRGRGMLCDAQNRQYITSRDVKKNSGRLILPRVIRHGGGHIDGLGVANALFHRRRHSPFPAGAVERHLSVSPALKSSIYSSPEARDSEFMLLALFAVDKSRERAPPHVSRLSSQIRAPSEAVLWPPCPSSKRLLTYRVSYYANRAEEPLPGRGTRSDV